ncbi:hypothetical protein CEXT_410611 [Caerostris extrusa]|uniref:Uncharacterized protein n=1 Tax=Caerostris extrusa TaxID=172846 RepID=A0AAV4RUS9_CAEEX|nr:hypothetical protein CEXT_410611 [Caerostris extrusa]
MIIKASLVFIFMNSFNSEGSESVAIPERDSSKLTEDSEEHDSSVEDLKDSMKCLNLLESYISNDEGEKWEKEVLAMDSRLDEQADVDFSRLRKTIDIYRNESPEKMLLK